MNACEYDEHKSAFGGLIDLTLQELQLEKMTISSKMSKNYKKSKIRPKNYLRTAASQLRAQNAQAVKRIYVEVLH